MLYRLVNPSEQPLTVHLTNENALLDRLDAFLLDADTGQVRQQIQLGLSQPGLGAKHVALRHQDALRLDARQRYFLLFRLKSDTPLALATKVTAAPLIDEENRQRYARYWAMLVTVLAIFLFNAVLSLGYRDSAYRWFLGFHGFTIVYFSALTGFGHLYLPLVVIRFLADHIMALNFLLLFLLYEFSLHFLSQERRLNDIRKPWYRWGLPAVQGIGFLISLVAADFYLLAPFLAVQVLTIVPVLMFAWRQARSGYAPAYFLFLSILVQTIGGSVGLSTFAGWVPANSLTLYAFFITTVIELLIMSYALSARIRFLERRQRNLLLRESTTQLPNEAYLNQILEPWWSNPETDIPSNGAILIELRGFNEITHIMGPRTSLKVWSNVIQQWNDFLSRHKWVQSLPTLAPSDKLVIINRDTMLALIDIHPDHRCQTAFEAMRNLDVDCEGQVFGVESRIAMHEAARDMPLDELMRELSVAMVTARRHNRFVQPYDAQQDRYFRRQNRLSRDLRTAATHKQLNAHVQPILDLKSHRIIGGELLLRWTHPELGPIPPSEFIPLAEEMRWQPELTRFVLDEAARWLNNTPELDLMLSINLSVLDLIVQDDGADLPLRIESMGLPAHRLKVEVTETVLMEQPDQCQQTLDQLRRLGCRISIDDFGTGYCSLAYLSRIRPDEIKIDRSFVTALESSTIDRDIVAAIVRLAHNMGACIVAEGVEDMSNLNACRELECDRIQGYLIARPMPLHDFRAWLSSYRHQSERERS
ncbi:hypothetical protein GCM10007392_03750 [Saccharospirillum salsuginis]|uniref:EAL domain-containing protein n=2 Tax=Saccharospirillum salsuginis TaxID=418750 RepID=A0A918K0J2_9GAMM|nr:hypothetical protein GCM10007392_03750 [Saccharospirillum salsuginis]